MTPLNIRPESLLKKVNDDYARKVDEAKDVYEFGEGRQYIQNDETQTFDRAYQDDGELPTPEITPESEIGNPEKRKRDLIANNPGLVYKLTGDPEAKRAVVDGTRDWLMREIKNTLGEEAFKIANPTLVEVKGLSRAEWRDAENDLIYQIGLAPNTSAGLRCYVLGRQLLKRSAVIAEKDIFSLEDVVKLIAQGRERYTHKTAAPNWKAMVTLVGCCWGVFRLLLIVFSQDHTPFAFGTTIGGVLMLILIGLYCLIWRFRFK